MKRLMLVLAVTILALATAAYGQTKGANGQPKELIVGASRDRISAPSLNHSANRLTATSNGLIASAEASNTRPRSGTVVATAVPTALPDIYRVGIGDVLDIHLPDLPTAKSTLFTVMEGGFLDYPLSSAPVTVLGLTTDEIAERLRANIKVLDNPKVAVKVRDYSSHSVIVTGLVLDPGAKFLRREATPLYVVLAEAQPRGEAARATINRSNAPLIDVDLKDQKALATLVMPGDVIKLLAPPADLSFFFATGLLNSPGQKPFHKGLTLTQAIIASGGINRSAGNKVKVSRQGVDGRLNTTEYNLRQIEEGKSPDPLLQAGDRIAVSGS
jgi:protein involved in polysaccharide export with SLBB domain